MIYLLALAASFCGIFLKGLQVQNITKGHYVAAILTSYSMAVTDVITVGLVAHNGWEMALPVGTGGSMGIVLSIYVHRKYTKK